MGDQAVQAFIRKLEPAKVQVVGVLRQILLKAAPDAEESVERGMLMYRSSGDLAYIRIYPKSVSLGFCHGSRLPDPRGLLRGAGERLRHIRLTSQADIDERAFAQLVRHAVAFNRSQEHS